MFCDGFFFDEPRQSQSITLVTSKFSLEKQLPGVRKNNKTIWPSRPRHCKNSFSPLVGDVQVKSESSTDEFIANKPVPHSTEVLRTLDLGDPLTTRCYVAVVFNSCQERTRTLRCSRDPKLHSHPLSMTVNNSEGLDENRSRGSSTLGSFPSFTSFDLVTPVAFPKISHLPFEQISHVLFFTPPKPTTTNQHCCCWKIILHQLIGSCRISSINSSSKMGQTNTNWWTTEAVDSDGVWYSHKTWCPMITIL